MAVPMSFSASASANSDAKSSGTAMSPWYQGDMAVSWAAGAVNTGARTAPAQGLGGLSGLGVGTTGGGLGLPLLLAGLIVIGAIAWRASR